MQRSRLFLLGLCLTFCFFSSCVIAVVEYSDEGIPVLDKFQRVIPLDFGGTLSLENIKGDIEISGWDREEVEVYAEKMFPRSLKKRVHIFRRRISTPKIDIDKFEDFIKIKTLEEEGGKYHLTLTDDEFILDMHYCPSVGKLLNTHLEPYDDYCGHCPALYSEVIEKNGFHVDYYIINRDKGQCRMHVNKIK